MKVLMMETGLGVWGLAVETITTLLAVAAVVYKLGRAVEKFEVIGKQQAMEIGELKTEVKVVADVLTKLALANQRQDVLEERLERQEQLVDDLRRGEGYVLPLNPPSHP